VQQDAASVAGTIAPVPFVPSQVQRPGWGRRTRRRRPVQPGFFAATATDRPNTQKRELGEETGVPGWPDASRYGDCVFQDGALNPRCPPAPARDS
jgi:hypothetical protein